MTWWRHQMETFSALLAICAGNSPVPGEFPTQRPVTRGFDVFFDLRLNKRLSKQSWGWWLETLSCSLWRQSNEGNQMVADGFPLRITNVLWQFLASCQTNSRDAVIWGAMRLIWGHCNGARLCFVMFRYAYMCRSLLPIFFRVTTLAVGKSWDNHIRLLHWG